MRDTYTHTEADAAAYEYLAAEDRGLDDTPTKSEAFAEAADSSRDPLPGWFRRPLQASRPGLSRTATCEEHPGWSSHGARDQMLHGAWVHVREAHAGAQVPQSGDPWQAGAPPVEMPF